MARKSNPILDILQTVATIEDPNITEAKMPADKDIIICYLEYGRMQDLPRVGPTFRVLDEFLAVRARVHTRREFFLNGAFYSIFS